MKWNGAKRGERSEFLRTALGSLTQRGSTFWRALCAAVIVALTLWMTYNGYTIPVEWETIFLVVIGYYFKDRPLEEKLHRDRAGDSPGQRSARPLGPEDRGVIGEMTYQFILASLLILGAVAAFIKAAPTPTIPASWIGGVVLAVGFYFKESSIETLEPWHERFRLFIALEVIAATVPLLLSLVDKTAKTLNFPLQWAGVVLIVVAFYFKEKKPGNPPARDGSPKAA
jgi:hypothetical protein